MSKEIPISEKFVPGEVSDGRFEADVMRSLAVGLEQHAKPSEVEQERVEQIFKHAEIVVDRMRRLSPNPEQGRVGGVFAIRSFNGENSFYATRDFGPITSERLIKYYMFAFAKSQVLAQGPQMGSSAENANLTSQEQLVLGSYYEPPVGESKPDPYVVPGGGLRIGKNIVFTFSGFNESAELQDDQAVVLATCILAGEMSTPEALNRASAIGGQGLRDRVVMLITDTN